MEGIWYMAVYKDKNKSTWYVSKRYTDWDGSKKRLFKRGFQTKREALEYELSFVSKISDNQKMLFKDFIPIYYEDLEKRVRKNTMITKKNIIEIKIRPYFDELRLCDITPKEVMRWQNQMLDGKKKNGKSYAGDTLIKMHAQLSAILNHACKYYGLRTNAAAQTGCFKVKTKKEQQFWTLDEYRKFVDAVSDKTLSYICFEVLFWCGLRLGELRALTKKDIDLVNQTIQIDKSLQIIEGETVITDPKTETSIRTIDLPDFLCDELKNYMEGKKMKKFISTLLCIVFAAALMPAQIAKADSDVMSVANQVKVPILNEQTYNNKKLMNKYTRDMSDWWATDLTLTAGMLFKRCDVDNAYYQYWGSINEAVETMGMALSLIHI